MRRDGAGIARRITQRREIGVGAHADHEQRRPGRKRRGFSIAPAVHEGARGGQPCSDRNLSRVEDVT
jgi:hypothetical protein